MKTLAEIMELPMSKKPDKGQKEVHQSELRACHELVRVKQWLRAGVPSEVILELIYEMESAEVKIKKIAKAMLNLHMKQLVH